MAGSSLTEQADQNDFVTSTANSKPDSKDESHEEREHNAVWEEGEAVRHHTEALLVAVDFLDVEMVQGCFERVERDAGPIKAARLVDLIDWDGNTLLHRCSSAEVLDDRNAIASDARQVVELLTIAGADVHANNLLGETPLLCSVRSSSAVKHPVVEALLVARADPGCADILTRETALMEAACAGDVSLCRILISAGAPVNAKDASGRTALQIAVTAGCQESASQWAALGVIRALIGARATPAEVEAWRAPNCELHKMAGTPAGESICKVLQDAGADFPWLRPSRMEVEAVEQEKASPTFRPRERRGGLRQRCEAQDIPMDVLGTFGATDVLREVDRLNQLTLEDLRLECEAKGMASEAQLTREKIISRLRQGRVWTLMPLASLQELCRTQAAHVIDAESLQGEEGALDRDRLIEALTVATWGGATRNQKVHERHQKLRCAAREVPINRLGNIEKAENILQQVERFEMQGVPDLRNEYKKRGFPLNASLTKAELISKLQESLIWEEMPLSELRQVVKEQQLPLRGDMRRTELMHLLISRSWEATGIPLMQLPSTLVAHGVLESFKRLEPRSLNDVQAECRKMNLPIEVQANKQVLLSRIRDLMVWRQVELPELRHVCQARGLDDSSIPCSSINETGMQRWDRTRALREERQNLLNLLIDSIWASAWRQKGIEIEMLGDKEIAQGLFEEVQRLEGATLEELKGEYEKLGLPLEASLSRKEFERRICKILIWSYMPLQSLKKECEACNVPSDKLNTKAEEEEQCRELVDRLIADVCVTAWEENGLPVRRLGGWLPSCRAMAAFAEFDKLTTKDLAAEYSNLGLGKSAEVGTDRKQLLERLHTVQIWWELPTQELRKDCREAGLSPMGEHAELVQRLAKRKFVATEKPRDPRDVPKEQPKGKSKGFHERFAGRPGPHIPHPHQTQEQQQQQHQQQRQQGQAPVRAGPQANMMKHYRFLEISPTAGLDDVRKAYRKMALQYHPDKNLVDEKDVAVKKFQQVAEAYEAICLYLRRTSP